MRERLFAMQRRSPLPIVLAAALAVTAGFVLSLGKQDPAAAGPMDIFEPSTGVGPDTGSPPPEMRLRAIVARALDDAVATWSRRLEGRAVEIASVDVRFVSRLAPDNCYGLYTGDGPAYCSGNHTVFVGTAAANRLMSKFGPHAEAGITFLIGHEIGHHIQNLHGRFYALSRAIYASPQDAPDYVRRFELQADCLAGVWIHDSPAWATSHHFRASMLSVLNVIGDDNLLAGIPEARAERVGLHGTGKQRTRWFLRGALSGDIDACDTFSATAP